MNYLLISLEFPVLYVQKSQDNNENSCTGLSSSSGAGHF